jgi:hypothetical protein
MEFDMKNLTLLSLVLFAFLFIGIPAVAQDEDTEVAPAVEVEDADIVLPDWLSQLAIGTVSLSSFVWAITEVVKGIMKRLNLYKDGYGRFVVVAAAIGFVALMIISQTFEVQGLVTERMEWVYQLMLFVLTLLGAPTVHKAAKLVGISEDGYKYKRL